MTDLEKLALIQSIAENYVWTDGPHHKQYALVEIIKTIQGDNYKAWVDTQVSHPDDWDKGTP